LLRESHIRPYCLALLAMPLPLAKYCLTLRRTAIPVESCSKGHHVRAAALYRGLKQNFAGDWRRVPRLCLAVVACLAQLPGPVPHFQVPLHPIFSNAGTNGAAGAAPASLAARQSGVPCALHGARTSPDNGANSPAPCPNGDCPFCPCPCYAPLQCALGVLPQGMSRAAYAPSFSAIPLPPIRLGSALRFAVIAGQPRAPPILI